MEVYNIPIPVLNIAGRNSPVENETTCIKSTLIGRGSPKGSRHGLQVRFVDEIEELDASCEPESPASCTKQTSKTDMLNVPFSQIFEKGVSSSRSVEHQGGDSQTTDADSHKDTELPKKFRTALLKKFGTKSVTDIGLVDAMSISHVYMGNVLVTDFLGSKVVLYNSNGDAISSFILGGVTEPWDAVMTPQGKIGVTLQRQRCVALLSEDGKTTTIIGEEELQKPAGIAADKQSCVYVVDEALKDVLVYSDTGTLLYQFSDVQSSPFKHPRCICYTFNDRIIVTDSGDHTVKVFTAKGQFLFKFGSYGHENRQFRFPYGVCADDHNNIIVADHHNNRVVLFSAEGEFIQNLLTTASGIKCPSGVAVGGGQNRQLYVTHGGLKASEVAVFNINPIHSEVIVNVTYFI